MALNKELLCEVFKWLDEDESASKCALVCEAWDSASAMTFAAYSSIVWDQGGHMHSLFRLLQKLKAHGRAATLTGSIEISEELLRFLQRCWESDVGVVRLDMLRCVTGLELVQQFPAQIFSGVQGFHVAEDGVMSSSELRAALQRLSSLTDLVVECTNWQQRLCMSDLPSGLTHVAFTGPADVLLDARMQFVQKVDMCPIQKPYAPGMKLCDVFPCAKALKTGVYRTCQKGVFRMSCFAGIEELTTLRGLTWNCPWAMSLPFSLPPALQVLALVGDVHGILSRGLGHARIDTLVLAGPLFHIPSNAGDEVKRLRKTSFPRLKRAVFIRFPPTAAVVQGGPRVDMVKHGEFPEFAESCELTVWEMVSALVL